MSDRSDDEVWLRKMAHFVRRARRRGEVVEGCEDIMKLMQEVLDDAVREEVLCPGAGHELLMQAFRKEEGEDDGE